MDELYEFCARVLGKGVIAEQAAREARAGRTHDRVGALAAAAAACRARDRPGEPQAPPESSDGTRALSAAVARELEAATARLPERQREALALRELLDLSYDQIGSVVGIEATAVAPLLARARLRLRAELRGIPETEVECAEREQALRALAQRQDSESVDDAQTGWLLEHLGGCEVCTQAHAAMLEAGVCYRAWPTPGSGRSGAGREPVSP